MVEVIRLVPVRIYDDSEYCSNGINVNCRYLEIYHTDSCRGEDSAWCNLFYDKDLDPIELKMDLEAREWCKCNECKKVYKKLD